MYLVYTFFTHLYSQCSHSSSQGRCRPFLLVFRDSLSYRMARKFVINLKLCAHFVPQAEGQAICNLHFDNLCCIRPGNGGHKHISRLPGPLYLSYPGPPPTSWRDRRITLSTTQEEGFFFNFTKDMVSGEWIDYADCQGPKHSHTLRLQFGSQLDVSCHTLCQLAKDENKGKWGKGQGLHRVSSAAFCPIARTNWQIDGQCEWRRLITLITAPFIIRNRIRVQSELESILHVQLTAAIDMHFAFDPQIWFADCHRSRGFVANFACVSLSWQLAKQLGSNTWTIAVITLANL